MVYILSHRISQFGSQEPGSNSQVKDFAVKQGAKFPIMAKIDVNGEGASPLFKFLKEAQPGLLTNDVKWNFSECEEAYS
jgi:glutathione peroxidase-family protein